MVLLIVFVIALLVLAGAVWVSLDRSPKVSTAESFPTHPAGAAFVDSGSPVDGTARLPLSTGDPRFEGCRRVRPIELQPGDVLVGSTGADPVVTGVGWPFRDGGCHWWGVPTSAGQVVWKLDQATRFDLAFVRVPVPARTASATVPRPAPVAGAGGRRSVEDVLAQFGPEPSWPKRVAS